MKLGSLFPSTNSLAKSSATTKTTSKPSLFGNSFGSSYSKPSKPPGLRQQTKETKASGLFSIKWPSMPKQEAKDYGTITTRSEWIEYLKRCKETGLASFDWETAPMKATRLRWEDQKRDFKIRRLAAKADLDSKMPGGPVNPKKLTPAEKRHQKEYDGTIAAIEKDYEAALKKFNRTPLDPWSGEICTLSISAAPHESRVIFISHKEGAGNYGGVLMDRNAARMEVLNLLEEMIFQDPDIIKIAFNLPFETKYAAKYGKYIVGKCADPMVMIVRVLQVAAPQKIQSVKAPYMGKSLKKMTKEYLGVQMAQFTEVVGDGFFDELSTDDPKAISYSAEDSDYGLQLYLYFDEVAKQIPNAESCPYSNYSEWLHDIEMPFGRVIGLMEYWGMQWNNDDAAAKRREAAEKQKEASDKIRQIAADLAATGDFRDDQVEELNKLDPGKTGKTGAVKHLLFDILKLPIASKSKKTDDPSLDNNAILDMIFMLENKLINLDEERFLNEPLPEGTEDIVRASKIEEYAQIPTELPDHLNPEKGNDLERGQRVRIRILLRDQHKYAEEAIDLLKTIQLISKYSTLLSSHIVGREKYVNDVSGRIHANYTPWTQTSRLSSNSPNGQNVPRPDNDVFGIRNLYKAPDGKVLTFIDFSGFELRLMAWRSNCEVMIQAICDGEDLHRKTAARLTGKIEGLVTKHERSEAKSGNFGVNYGGTEHALQDTFKGYGIRKTLEECKKVVDAVLSTYPGIPKYQRDVVLDARADGYVETMYGYKRLLPDINHPSGGRRSSDERRAGNTPIQGAAADYMKDCQNLVYDRIGRDTYADRKYKETTDIYFDYKDLGPGFEYIDNHYDVIFVHGTFDMIAQIHDEIIFEVDNNEEKVRRGMTWVQEIMERPPLPGFPVPIEAEASAGYMWGEKFDLDKWVCIGGTD